MMARLGSISLAFVSSSTSTSLSQVVHCKNKAECTKSGIADGHAHLCSIRTTDETLEGGDINLPSAKGHSIARRETLLA